MIDQSTQHNRDVGPKQTPQFTDYPRIIEKVQAGVERGLVRVLFTDIDATLVLGAGHTDYEIERGKIDTKELLSMLNSRGDIIIPTTGGHFQYGTSSTPSVFDRILSGVLPSISDATKNGDFNVDAYVSDGGACAVFAHSANLVQYDSHYQRTVEPQSLPYDALLNELRSLAETICSGNLAPLDWDTIKSYDDHVDPEQQRIFLQDGTKDGAHRSSNKVAFHFYASTLEERDYIEARFKSAASAYKLGIICCEEKDANSKARRVLTEESSHEGFPLKYCLDIVPFSKASAVEHFSSYINHLIVQTSLSSNSKRPQLEVWACGDAGNDLPLLDHPAVTHCVIVGGASRELASKKELLESRGKIVYSESDSTIIGPGSILKALKSR